MSLIIPFSSLQTEARNPATAARYPGLKHFFQCKELAGSTVITDSITGLTFTGLTGLVRSTDGFGVDFSTLGAINGVGAFTNIGTSPFLALAVGKFSSTGGTIDLTDSTTGSGFALTSAGGTVTNDGATIRPAALTAFTSDTSNTRGRAVVVSSYNANATSVITGMHQIDCGTTASATVVNTAKDLTGLTTPVTTNSAAGAGMTLGFNVNHTALNSLMIWAFPSGVPADYQAAVVWMAYQHSINNKVAWPGWLLAS